MTNEASLHNIRILDFSWVLAGSTPLLSNVAGCYTVT